MRAGEIGTSKGVGHREAPVGLGFAKDARKEARFGLGEGDGVEQGLIAAAPFVGIVSEMQPAACSEIETAPAGAIDQGHHILGPAAAHVQGDNCVGCCFTHVEFDRGCICFEPAPDWI